MSTTRAGRRRAGPSGHRVRRVVLNTSVVSVLLGLVAAVVALTFSVQVSGTSMSPTIRPGDRLVADVLHRSRPLRRFELVDAQERTTGTSIVKRVIGLPGDTVEIVGGDRPRVMIRPKGSRDWYEVDNPAWTSQVAGQTASCCTATGTSQAQRAAVTVPDGSYWLLGDNWGGSTDSRVFGWVSRASIGARLTYRILPLDRRGRLTTEARLVTAMS